MPLNPIRAIPSKNQSELECAWAIYCALTQYNAEQRPYSDTENFQQSISDAYDNLIRLFAE